MTSASESPTIAHDSAVGVKMVTAIQRGDLERLATLLDERPALAVARVEARDGGVRSPLHLVTDWPGYFENGPAVVTMLLAAGADPNVVFTGRHAETPLHWAASSDDAEVAAVLIDGGAHLEVQSGSIGTPLANAVGYGCWRVARLLVTRGARVDRLWQAAALGLHARVDDMLSASPAPTTEDITEAFWQACHGGERRMAARLLARGANPATPPDYFARQTPVQVASALDTGRERLVEWLQRLERK
ncbi:MAG: ankyrin repeat domain-containing protein [Gemmatimonadaceae bacterium]|nr:ankyrin repeat domain-containing protein [Gemmatimonadaceae bacterium]